VDAREFHRAQGKYFLPLISIFISAENFGFLRKKKEK
jgi:hypothetical protein